jgi:hypothetical protein
MAVGAEGHRCQGPSVPGPSVPEPSAPSAIGFEGHPLETREVDYREAREVTRASVVRVLAGDARRRVGFSSQLNARLIAAVRGDARRPPGSARGPGFGQTLFDDLPGQLSGLPAGNQTARVGAGRRKASRGRKAAQPVAARLSRHVDARCPKAASSPAASARVAAIRRPQAAETPSLCATAHSVGPETSASSPRRLALSDPPGVLPRPADRAGGAAGAGRSAR